jgi:hypothetical protein
MGSHDDILVFSTVLKVRRRRPRSRIDHGTEVGLLGMVDPGFDWINIIVMEEQIAAPRPVAVSPAIPVLWGATEGDEPAV